MAKIDVSSLLSDPDLSDTFAYIRRVGQVDQYGRAFITQLRNNALGIIQPARAMIAAQVMRLNPEMTNIMGAIEIWTATPLQIETDRLKADLIFWKNTYYIVATLMEDWTNIGGFVHAICTLHDLATEGTNGSL